MKHRRMKRRANKSGLHVNPLSSKKNTVAIFFIDHADQFRQIFDSRSLTNHHVHSTGKSFSCLLFCRTFLTRPHDANFPTLLAVPTMMILFQHFYTVTFWLDSTVSTTMIYFQLIHAPFSKIDDD